MTDVHPPDELAEEVRITRSALTDEAFTTLVQRLNRQSVERHHDAYLDIAWDDPALSIEPTDPRFAGAAEGLFEGTGWWEGLDEATRARLGLHVVVMRMKSGVVFENILSRGLLRYAASLDDRDPEFRYTYHEVIEESQHSLMFQEFIDRSGLDTGRLPLRIRLGAGRVVTMATRFPELFFVFVLGGEDPIDHVQRQNLRDGVDHPLLERIMRIHVTEEARHLSFARHQLKRRVERLPRWKRTVLAYAAPLILNQMADQMMGVPPHLVEEYEIPADVVATVRRDPAQRREVVASLGKVSRLLEECGLRGRGPRRLWRALSLEP